MKKLLLSLIVFFILGRGYVFAEEDPYSGFNLFWGDIHGHTEVSDGQESPESYYSYARSQKLDFAAVTDHAERIENYPADWEYLTTVANDFYQPGSFVTFVSFEWSGKSVPAGHKNVYYKGSEGPLITSNRNAFYPQPLSLPEAKDPYALWNFLKDYEALTIPHHTLAQHCNDPSIPMSTDWSYFNEQMQVLVEIYSKWGSSEHQGLSLSRPAGCYVEGRSVQDALSLGHKLGFVGGSDTHYSKPGSQNLNESDKYPALMFPNSGLTAVWARNLTREEIFNALKKRRTYATSGSRTILKFSADGHLMGEEFTSFTNPKFKIEVKPAGASIEFVKIIKGWKGRETPFQPPEIDSCHDLEECVFEWEDKNFTQDSFYYLRVKQKDGHLAWSSPIWVNKGIFGDLNNDKKVNSADLEILLANWNPESGKATSSLGDLNKDGKIEEIDLTLLLQAFTY